jgi:hypothetical protein
MATDVGAATHLADCKLGDLFRQVREHHVVDAGIGRPPGGVVVAADAVTDERGEFVLPSWARGG